MLVFDIETVPFKEEEYSDTQKEYIQSKLNTLLARNPTADSEPCLVITPSRMFEGKPAVIPLSSAWKYSQMAFADPKVVAHQVRQFAIGMNKDSLAQVIALTDLINDCLSDLISMPPDPRERLVVADAEIVIDGRKRTIEVTE